jgi:hypothetical protein
MYAVLRPLPLALAVAEKAMFDFSNQWLAGLRPQLLLETGQDGQIFMSSRVAAGDVPTRANIVLRRPAAQVGRHQAEQVGQQPHRRRNGPSQQRRRLRRGSARAAAEKAVHDAESNSEAEAIVSSAAEAAAPATQVAAEANPPPHKNFRSVKVSDNSARMWSSSHPFRFSKTSIHLHKMHLPLTLIIPN